MPAPPHDARLLELATRLGALLLEARFTVTTAESCTGGWVAKAITDVAGSSQWFERGFVTYSNAAKQALLGVDVTLLETHGAVSEPVAAAMARGARTAASADCAIAVSGIAGPGGATPDKPVGTVCFAWVWPGRLETVSGHFEGSREDVRRQAVGYALAGLARRLGA